MSVFLVSDVVINRAVSWLSMDAGIRREILEGEIPFDLGTADGQRALAETMFRLSVDAVTQRYGRAKTALFRPLEFEWKPERVIEMEGFEALCCWLHQCTESDVPKVSKLWQLIEIITGRIAVDTVLMRTPERAWPAEFLACRSQLLSAVLPACLRGGRIY